MKKPMIHLLTLSSALLLLSSNALTSIQAQEAFASKEEATTAAKAALAKDTVNNFYEISQGSDGKYYFTLSILETPNSAKVEETPSTTDTNKSTPVESNNTGFTKESDAVAAAKDALKTDAINHSYTISQAANGKYYYVLSPVKAEGNPQKSDQKAEQKVETTEKGYPTKEAAIEAAKKALASDPINRSFTVRQGADGKYYYLLSPLESDETTENEKVDEKPAAKPASQQSLKAELPQTGEASSLVTFGSSLVSALSGLFIFFKKK